MEPLYFKVEYPMNEITFYNGYALFWNINHVHYIEIHYSVLWNAYINCWIYNTEYVYTSHPRYLYNIISLRCIT